MSTPLERKLEKALAGRRKGTEVSVQDLLQECGSASAPDLFSNDYLSIKANPHVRQSVIKAVSSSEVVMGSGGTRLLSGNSPAHIDFERRMKKTFGAEAALVFHTGYDANLAFFNTVPQEGDVIIIDQLAHASMHDGVRMSRASGAVYAFKHNSVRALRECITRVLAKHEEIAKGNATLFIVVESLYSMDGDFAPLPEIVRAAKELVPEGCYHIFVDEAHSSGICGPQGRGFVAALGLTDHVQSVLHLFSKGRGFIGGVILTSPIVREYMVNYARPLIYSTSLPHIALIGLHASFDYIESEAGVKDMRRLRTNVKYFFKHLTVALASIHPRILSLTPLSTRDVEQEEEYASLPEDVMSPIIPVHTTYPLELQNYLRNVLGYRVVGIGFPIVPRGQGRIRVIVHTGNSLEELDTFIAQLVAWADSKADRLQSEGDIFTRARL